MQVLHADLTGTPETRTKIPQDCGCRVCPCPTTTTFAAPLQGSDLGTYKGTPNGFDDHDKGCGCKVCPCPYFVRPGKVPKLQAGFSTSPFASPLNGAPISPIAAGTNLPSGYVSKGNGTFFRSGSGEAIYVPVGWTESKAAVTVSVFYNIMNPSQQMTVPRDYSVLSIDGTGTTFADKTNASTRIFIPKGFRLAKVSWVFVNPLSPSQTIYVPRGFEMTTFDPLSTTACVSTPVRSC